MPYLSQNNRQTIEKLKDWYQSLPEEAQRLFPSKVSATILAYQSRSASESTQALELCRAFISEENSIQGWSYPYGEVGLETFALSSLISDAYALNCAGLLAGDAAQANFNAVAGEQGSSRVVEAFRLLSRKDMLTGGAAQANFDAVVGHRDPCRVAEALGVLHGAGLLTGDAAQINRDAVTGNQDYLRVAEALDMLHGTGLLIGNAAQANFNAVAGHQDPRMVVPALDLLNKVGLLIGSAAQTYRDAVAGNHTPLVVAFALELFQEAGLLTRDATQVNFDALILHSAILLHIEIARYWQRIPTHRFTPARFAALIEICQEHTENPGAGRDLVIAYINREILGINAAEGPRLVAVQTTHTASVHQSVSESAKRLWVRYGREILGGKLDERIRELLTWLDAQPDSSVKIRKAKRCLQRLTAPDYFFTDPGSGVSMKQLLALFWIAIHDDTRCMSLLDEATSQLVEGLYETQREHNISANGEDNAADDDFPSCPSGTFNKIIEKGQGVHPDMVINFISQAGFSLKLPLVVGEEAMLYLRSRANLNLASLIDAIKIEGNANSVGPIWAEIEAVVTDRMFDEFGSLFEYDRTSHRFVSAIAAGEFLALNPVNLSELGRLIDQVPQDGAAAAAVGEAPDGFFATAAPASAEKEIDIAAKRHGP